MLVNVSVSAVKYNLASQFFSFYLVSHPNPNRMKRNLLSSLTAHAHNRSRSVFLHLLLLLLMIAPDLLRAQVIVNAYARATAYNTGNRRISISGLVAPAGHTFEVDKDIIIMQMQDANILGSTNLNDNANFGNITNILNVGNFEVARVTAVTGGYLQVASPLQNTYNFTGTSRVQVISYRTYTDLTTTNNITAQAWNGSIGGVIAIRVTGTLTLSHNIFTDGLGFRGGGVSGNGSLACIATSYRNTTSSHGLKGEAIYVPANNRGRGKVANGGGGGAPNNAGGGGGSNFTAGGMAGHGWECEDDGILAGGIGGVALSSHITGSRIFMGGGGGGGQQNNLQGKGGAAGGGIIIIVANRLVTSCSTNVRISSNGINSVNSDGDGAGGGGGGGTVFMGVSNWVVPASCPLRIQGNAGNGGNVDDPNEHGGGGGGGQGAIVYSGPLPGMNVIATTLNGIGGENFTGGPRAQSGQGLDNSGIIVASSALPVYLENFDAAKQGETVLLKWNAFGAEQTKFKVQHSTDGNHFDDIGTVAGIRSTGPESYSFRHRDPVDGSNYYRLEMVEITNRHEYSTIVEVTTNRLTASTRLYPNPSSGQFTIKLRGTTRKNWKLSIIDMSGTVVYNQTKQSLNGNIEVSLNRTLAPGIYTLHLTADAETRTGKLFIQ